MDLVLRMEIGEDAPMFTKILVYVVFLLELTCDYI